jgi:hypothetical protein
VETAVNACVAVSYSVPIRVTGGINATARLLGAERPAKPPAKHAGSLPLRTRAISKGRPMSLGCRHGGPATRGIGVEPDGYKNTHWRNLLILLAKSAVSRALRYKIS